MTDRLRRLDKLFAERVLGHKVGYPKAAFYVSGQPRSDLWYIEGTDDENLTRPLPRYSKSLDAAWEGLEHLSGPKLAVVDFVQTACGWDATVGWGVYPERGTADCDDECDHPAEALVLACLRAVGTHEEALA